MRKNYRIKSQRHISANIEGILKHTKRGKLKFIDDDNGNQMTDPEARANLRALQVKGHKLIPSPGCYRFDPFGKGCKGHIKSLMPSESIMDDIELETALFKQGKRL